MSDDHAHPHHPEHHLASSFHEKLTAAILELLAEKNEPAIPALVPENDEMVLNNNGQFDPEKTDLYRVEIGQPLINARNNRTSSPEMYCQNMVNIQTPFLAANAALLATGQPPVTGVGNNLFTFLANRLNMSFTNLNCQDFGLTNPVTVTLNGAGAATAATFNVTPQKASTSTAAATGSTGTKMPPAGQRIGRGHGHRLMNPSGM